MLKHWNELLTTDCIVINVGPHTIYPIFKNGSSSLMAVADKTYVNKQIANCNNIIILLRDPEERFVSGINDCRFYKMLGCGHTPYVENSEKFFQIVVDFLD